MRKITLAHEAATSMLKRAKPYPPSPLEGGGVGKGRKKNQKKTARKLVFVKKGDPNWNQFKGLTEQMKENTSRALKELRDELKRRNGKVISNDYPKHRVVNADGCVEYINYYEMYSLDPKIILKEYEKAKRLNQQIKQ